MSYLSDMIVYLRKRDDMSQQELADKIGMTRSVVGMYETDRRKPSLEVLEAIADIFNVNIDFLVGRGSSGESSKLFRERLARILETASSSDIEATGLDRYELELIVSGTLPLSFDKACDIADSLGESIDSMLEKEEPTTIAGSGSSELVDLFSSLNSDNRSKLLELCRLFLNDQRNNGENP